MRKTKLICTIGPASDDEAILIEMAKAGMNVARCNFSHGDHNQHRARMDMIKKVREELNLPIAIMLDTKGPEYRIGLFKGDSIILNKGDKFTFTTDDIVGDNTIVSVSYKKLPQELEVGDTILVNNGLVVFKVNKISGNEIETVVIEGGPLSNRKSMSFPGKHLKQEFLSQYDKDDLLFGIENDVDFVAASFVSCKQDMLDMRDFLDVNGGQDIEIIAKIENQHGIDNIDEICEIADGIMVARGDLGVEIPFIKVPAIQKQLINKCRLMGKVVITATEMLESMINNPRPTRAEISDVANAVYDGTSAIMLSGESANGKYPVEATRNMANIAEFTEKQIDYAKAFKNTDFEIRNPVDAVSHATCDMAQDIKAKAIVCSSISGSTVKMVARFRSPIDILGVTTNEKVWYKLAMSWGVTPMMTGTYNHTTPMLNNALFLATTTFKLHKGDYVIITGGSVGARKGATDLIKLDIVQ
ncbi:MAG: pyruvate kinase [Bacilli bacterium]|nr:pyruvate kinase [Bacilli bacterium]